MLSVTRRHSLSIATMSKAIHIGSSAVSNADLQLDNDLVHVPCLASISSKGSTTHKLQGKSRVQLFHNITVYM